MARLHVLTKHYSNRIIIWGIRDFIQTFKKIFHISYFANKMAPKIL